MNLPRFFIAILCFPLIATSSVHAAADFTPVYLDGSNEGFNDPGAPHGPSSDGGNPGETLGGQRRWAFEKALEFWEVRLDSNVEIRIEAEMSDLPCDSTSAILGSAGANKVYRGTFGRADTWYGAALANKLANADLESSSNDIGSEFNKDIDASNDCLGSNVWYYALGDAPSGTVSFYNTVLHEVGHGINFQTLVNKSTGEKLSGFDDIYMVFLEDHSEGKIWPNMTNQERKDSAIDSNDLHWTGAEVLTSIGSLSSGTSGGHVEMYAPDPLEGGSSVSHWDTDVNDNNGNSEIMEPSATGAEKVTVTDELLHDLGWNDVPASNCTFVDDRISDSGRNINSTITHEACVSVTLGTNLIVTSNGALDALAGHQVFIRDGFGVEIGGTLNIDTDPGIGL